MSKVINLYCKQLARQFNYIPTWMPGEQIELGSVIVFSDKYNRQTKYERHDIEELLGLSFNEDIDQTGDSFEYTSKKGLEFNLEVKGDVTAGSAGNIKSEVSYKFGKKGALIFNALGVRYNSLTNLAEIGARVIQAYEDNLWKSNYHLITKVVTTDSCTIFLSNSKEGQVKCVAKGDLSAGFNIADPELGFTFSNYKSMETNYLAKSGLMPLFQTATLRKSLFKKPSFDPFICKSLDLDDETTAKEDLIFDNYSMNDYLGSLDNDEEDDE